MTKIQLDEVKTLARLAKLSLTDDEAIAFQNEITSILDFFKQLDEIDTSDVPATSQVTGLTNVARDDVVKDYGVSREDLLANVADDEDGFIKVEKVL